MRIEKGRFDRTRLVVRQNVGIIIDVALATGGMVLIFLGGQGATDIAGGIMTLVGAAKLFVDLLRRRDRHQRIRIEENIDYGDALADCRFPEGFQVFLGRLRQGAPVLIDQADLAAIDHVENERPYISNSEINALLDQAENPLQLEMESYQVPDVIQQHMANIIKIKRPHSDDPKIRLKTDVNVELLLKKRPVKIQNTSYFSSVVTNEMACSQFGLVNDNYEGRPQFTGAVADFVVSDGRLLGLSESQLSNHIGISTLILSLDDQLILQDQGDQAISANETAVGASGSLDRNDIQMKGVAKNLQALCRFGMEREADEELGAVFPPAGRNTVLVGYARYLARGAKPEFFGISRSLTRRSDLRPRQSERFVSGIRGIEFTPSRAGLIAAIDSLLDDGNKQRRRYSLSMVVNLRLARDWLQRADRDPLARLTLEP